MHIFLAVGLTKKGEKGDGPKKYLNMIDSMGSRLESQERIEIVVQVDVVFL